MHTRFLAYTHFDLNLLQHFQFDLPLVLKAWEIHEKSWKAWGKFPLKTIEHKAGAKFFGFHGHISMQAWEQENFKSIPNKSMESMDFKTMGIYKNESMGSMVVSSILLLIISGKHGNLCK